MNFSKRYKNTVLPTFSKCGKMIATANGSKVSVNNVSLRCLFALSADIIVYYGMRVYLIWFKTFIL